MKILFDLTSLHDHITGIERYAMEISRSFVEQFDRHQYVLLFKQEIHPDFIELSGQDNVRCVILKGRGKFAFSQITLLKALKKIKADAYVFLAFPQPLLFFSKSTYTAIHDMTPWEMGNTMKPLSRWYYRLSHLQSFLFSKKIITISRFSAHRIMKIAHVKPSRISLIRCGVTKHNSNDARTNMELPGRYVLTLSTLEPRKNLNLLIQAYCQVASEDKDYPDLVIAGRRGWMLEKQLVHISDNVKSRIHFTDYVADEDMDELYRRAMFFVFPSKYEGFGMPPLEAMSRGTLVLSSDAASMPEVLGRSACYFKNDSLQSLCNALRSMVTMDETSKLRRTENGIKRAKLFDWDNEAAKLERSL